MNATSNVNSFIFKDQIHNHTGIGNPSHNSNASIVYKLGSLSTPWPWLAVTYITSFLLGCIGYISAIRKHSKKPASPEVLRRYDGRANNVAGCEISTTPITEDYGKKPWDMRTVISYMSIGYITVRTLSIFGSVMANRDRVVILPSVIIATVFSVGPYLCNGSVPRYLLFVLVLDMVLLDVCWHNWYTNQSNQGDYDGTLSLSDVKLVGGNCPVRFDYMAQCRMARDGLGFVGCPQDGNFTLLPGYEPDTTFSIYNVADNAERTIGFWGEYVVLVATVMTGASVLFLLEGWRVSKLRQPPGKLGWKHSPKMLRWVSGLMIFASALTTMSMISTHMKAALKPDFPPYYVLDGMGSAVPVGSSDGLHWSDCFEVRIPQSKSGFFTDWWTYELSSAGKRFIHALLLF